jgi:hypothetical protein
MVRKRYLLIILVGFTLLSACGKAIAEPTRLIPWITFSPMSTAVLAIKIPVPTKTPEILGCEPMDGIDRR